MKPHLEDRAAKMRAGNTESLRTLAFRRIDRAVVEGRLTENEAYHIKLEFWEQRRDDQRRARYAR